MAFCYYAEVKRDDNGELFIERVINPELAPVIHAHWELYEDGWYCTNCELYAPFDCDPEENGVPYCPNCGAKMDEEVEDA